MNYHLEKYKPFSVVENFYLFSQNGVPTCLFYENGVSYGIPLSEAKYIPKSGLLLCESLEKICKNKKVLDIGTGYTAILATHAINFGAKHVDAIDLDEDVIHHVQKHTNAKSITAFVSNNFDNLYERKYDVIVSNPAQMPVTEHLNSIHDVSGKTGRENIEQIIKNAPSHLNSNGRLLFLAFGFLGVNTATHPSQRPIIELINENMEIECINRYMIKTRNNGAVSRNHALIEELYPNYKFFRMDGSIYNEIYVIQSIKRDNVS